MNLNATGTMIAEEWSSTLERFRGVTGDAFIVMPNHVHGIIAIGTDPEFESETPTLSRVLQVFKSLSTVAYGQMVRAGIAAPYDARLWQRGFHDHIIRNDRSLDEIREYIAGNPARWWERQHLA